MIELLAGVFSTADVISDNSTPSGTRTIGANLPRHPDFLWHVQFKPDGVRLISLIYE